MDSEIWKYVLYPHCQELFTFDSFQQVAKQTGYPFFCWGGKVYTTITGRPTGLSL